MLGIPSIPRIIAEINFVAYDLCSNRGAKSNILIISFVVGFPKFGHIYRLYGSTKEGVVWLFDNGRGSFYATDCSNDYTKGSSIQFCHLQANAEWKSNCKWITMVLQKS